VFRAPVRSPNAPLYAAAGALITWTIAPTLTWGAGDQARNPTVTMIRSARVWTVVAIQLVIALALAFYAADRVIADAPSLMLGRRHGPRRWYK
jgi:hypothetical protein